MPCWMVRRVQLSRMETGACLWGASQPLSWNRVKAQKVSGYTATLYWKCSIFFWWTNELSRSRAGRQRVRGTMTQGLGNGWFLSQQMRVLAFYCVP